MSKRDRVFIHTEPSGVDMVQVPMSRIEDIVRESVEEAFDLCKRAAYSLPKELLGSLGSVDPKDRVAMHEAHVMYAILIGKKIDGCSLTININLETDEDG